MVLITVSVVVAVVALAITGAVVKTSRGRFRRRREAMVVLTAAIASIEATRLARRSRSLGLRTAYANHTNVVALDDYRWLRSDRLRERNLASWCELTPRSHA